MLIALEIVLLLALAGAGACVFSFVNVLVYRMPRQLDWVRGRSFCPNCRHHLGAADLVPVLSWVFLRGKCRYCHAPIPVHDTVWELVGAVAALGCAAVWGIGMAGMLAFALFALLAAVAGIDHATRVIPNGLVVAVAIVGAMTLVAGLVPAETLPGLAAALPLPDPLNLGAALGALQPAGAAATATGAVGATGTAAAAGAASATASATAGATATASIFAHAAFPVPNVSPVDRIIGIFVASVPLFAIAFLTGGFGGGDVKLLAALGLCLGWPLTLLTLFGAILFGGIYGIWLLATKKAGRKDAFAFGPFICAAAVVSSVTGYPLIHAYLAAFGLA
jgi:prepilin signal peptidase PulO-like enzyme (type II secretory pathway)